MWLKVMPALALVGCSVDQLSSARSTVIGDDRQRLALAAVGSREPLRVFAETGPTFRLAFERADPLAWGFGVTWLDYDADGLDDLLATYGHPPGLLLLHNDDEAGLSTAAEYYGGAGALHAFDEEGDGDGDVWVAERGGGDYIARAVNGELAYAWSDPNDLSAWEGGVDSGDLDGDGYPEIAVARGAWWGERLYRGGPDGPTTSWTRVIYPPPWDPAVEPQPPPEWEPTDVAFVDFDGDGDLEVSFSELNDPSGTDVISVYRWNAGSLTLMWQSDRFGRVYQLDWIDYDGDGDQDLTTLGYDPATGGEELRLYRRTGASFHRVAFDNTCGIFTWGDYDDDNDPDLACGGRAVTIFENVGGALVQVFQDARSATQLSWGRCGTGSLPCFAAAVPIAL